VPVIPDHVAVSLDDGMAVADGVDTETVVMQVVDSAGNLLTYKRDVYVTLDGSAVVTSASDTADPLPAGAALVSTDGDGLAWVIVADAVQESVQVQVTTDGTNGSSVLPGSNESVSITFHPPGFGALDHFTFTVQHPSEIASGVPFTVTIEARDAANVLTSAFSGTVAMEDLTGTVSPQNILFSGGVFSGLLTVSPSDAYPNNRLTVRYGVRSGQSAAFDLTAPIEGIRNNVINPNNGDLVYISFTVSAATKVRARVYDLAGNPVKVLASRTFQPGAHTLTWDGKNRRNRSCVRGVYYILLQTGKNRTVYKVLVIR
jgi:hypothetical protein